MNKMKFIKHFQGVFITLLLCPAMLWAGITGKISGRVADAETGDPLPGANVIIVGTMLGAAADAEGDYFVINIPPGTYNVEATMIGYQGITMTGVLVSTDNTTPLDFSLSPTAIELETVMVTAEREVISMDQSASYITATAEEIVDVPLMTDIAQYIALQTGIEGDIIRGGSLDQTQFFVDGLMVVDNRSNQPMVMVNLSAVQELTVIKGGFNAEYGNVRSGLINVVTKEGSMERYHGYADIRFSPAQLKHSGSSIFARDNYNMRPFMDPDVMWDGTSATGAGNTDGGEWSIDMRHQYMDFEGWKSVADREGGTPQDWYNRFLWLHRAEGSGALGQKEGSYGDKSDMNVDVSLGGPIPILPNLSFFTSYRKNIEQFALPTNRNAYEEQNILFKLTSRLTPSMKLSLEVLNGTINTVARTERGYSGYINNYVKSGPDILSASNGGYGDDDMRHYFPSILVPFDIKRNMQGISLDHQLSPRTFYNFRLTHITLKHEAYGAENEPDYLDRLRVVTDTVTFKDGAVLEGSPPANWPKDLSIPKDTPYGFWYANGNQTTLADKTFGGVGGAVRDSSEINTFNVKFDITSQVNKYHQLKAGFEFNYDDIKTRQASISLYLPSDNSHDRWDRQPYRLGAYIQDKLEFEGMIANFGLRLDYNEPNTEWFTLERYSKYLARKYRPIFQEALVEEATLKDIKEQAKGYVKISPRIGISHPITETAKFFFNYGHFYSMPTSTDMYGVGYGSQAEGVDFLGNPSADLPKTVAYELGVETTLFKTFLVRLMGYYKDVSAQTGEVEYTNYDGTVDYETIENNNYEDIRGFELQIERRFGRLFRGWLNYNYMVSTEGYTGREHYYQDERLNRIYGLQNPYQEVPLARPYARANVTFTMPAVGPEIAGQSLLGNVDINLLYRYKSGRYRTWDPLETYQLQDNLHWKSEWYIDARISKLFRFGTVRFTVFADINNLLNREYIAMTGFNDDTEDLTEYYESLRLPMYKDEEYSTYWAEDATPHDVAFDDRPGDVGGPGTDKPWINMPDRGYLTYLNPRSIFLGIKFEF